MTKNQQKNRGKLLSYYKRHLGAYFGFLFCIIVRAAGSFARAIFLARIISSIMEGQYEASLKYAILELAVLLLNSVFHIISTYFFKKLENNVKFDLQQDVVRASLDIEMSAYDKAGTGLFLTRFTQDISKISDRFKSITTSLVGLVSKVSAVIYVFFLNWYLGLFLLGNIILTNIFYGIRVHFLNKLKPNVLKKEEQVNSKIIEVLRGTRDVKVLNLAESLLHNMGEKQKEYIKADNHEWHVGISWVEISQSVGYICNFLFIFLSLFLLKEQAVVPVVFYTIYLYKEKVIDFANILGDLRINLRECKVMATRVLSIMDEQNFKRDAFGSSNVENYSGRIEFKNVGLQYESGINALKQASFVIEPMQTVAFVGASGSGKSSVINLIAHLYNKNEGEILFDKERIENVSREFIKNNIAVVNQFPYIFNMTLMENFKLVRPDITYDEVKEVCRQVGLLEHIESLPNKFDAKIGEAGCQFSGGQRQKICIARALLRNAKILIFDEATSALDNNSQVEIMKIIKDLKNKATIILIAHRLSTVLYADNIYFMEDGAVIAHGTHKDLLQNCKDYNLLYNKQN